MMIRMIRGEVKRIAEEKIFLACVAMVFVLCLLAEVYRDPFTGRGYSAIASLIELDQDLLQGEISFYAGEVAKKGVTGWLAFFAPILAAFPAVALHCDEEQFRMTRFKVVRSSKLKSQLVYCISSFVSGALVMLVGYLLFLLFASSFFRMPSSLSEEELEFYALFTNTPKDSCAGIGFAFGFLRNIARISLWGGLQVMPALALTGISKNKYVVLCIPFFLKYAVQQICMKKQYIHPDALLFPYEYGENEIRVMVFWFLGVSIACIMAYCTLWRRRIDCGE